MKHITLENAQDIWAEIEKAHHILMHCHPSSDGDSLGSTLGLKHVLEASGKKVTVIKGDTDLPQYLSFLPGFDTIVLKNYFEVSLEDFDLFLILDSASLDQVSRIQPIVFPSTLKTIVIDHHASNEGFADLNFIDASYPATCQMVVDLAKAWGKQLTHDAAVCLFIGIYTDTGGFQWFTDKKIAPKTYHIAAELVDTAPDVISALFHIHNNRTKGRLKFEGLLITSIQTWFGDRVAAASISYADIQKHGFETADIEGGSISNTLKSVIGWDIGLTLIETSPNKVKISFRTRNNEHYDLSKVAVELGGGGHKGAAGVNLNLSLPESIEKVKAALAKVYQLS